MMLRLRASTAFGFGNVLIAGMIVSMLALADPCDHDLAITRLTPDTTPYTLSSGIDEPGQFVIRNAEDLAALWQDIHSRRRPAPPLPEVDFDREMMVVVAAGQRRTGGYSIRIDRAWREGDATIVLVHEEAPAAGCIVPTAITSPVDVARLPAVPEPVEIRLESVIRACD